MAEKYSEGVWRPAAFKEAALAIGADEPGAVYAIARNIGRTKREVRAWLDGDVRRHDPEHDGTVPDARAVQALCDFLSVDRSELVSKETDEEFDARVKALRARLVQQEAARLEAERANARDTGRGTLEEALQQRRLPSMGGPRLMS